MKESTIEKVTRERKDMLDALNAVEEFHKALDHFENAAYRGDALTHLNEKKAVWEQCREKVKPYLKGAK